MGDCISSSSSITHLSLKSEKLGLGFINCNSSSLHNRNQVSFKTFSNKNFVKTSDFCNSTGLNPYRKVKSSNSELFDVVGTEENPKKGKQSAEDEELEKIRLNSTQESDFIGFVNEEDEDNEKRNGNRSDEILGRNDFMDFQKEKKSSSNLGDDEIVRVKSSDEDDSKSGEVEKFNGKMGLRNGRQMMMRSNLLAKQVISVQSALSFGFVSQLWVDTNSWVVLVMEVRPSLLSGEIERFLLEEVCRVGDVVLVEDESIMENGVEMIGLHTLVGYNVMTTTRRNLGKVRGYTFNINSGSVELLELDSFGFSVVPSSLVSTYALFVEDVIEVVSDTVVVHETTASRLQRLTKGFWDSPNVDTSLDELDEDSDFSRRRPYNEQSRRKSFRSKRSPSKRRVSEEDEWDLPIDYL